MEGINLGLGHDVRDWNERLDDNERFFIFLVLALFAADRIVNENIVERFSTEVHVAETRCFYGLQIMMGYIHSETYSVLIVVSDPEQHAHIFVSIEAVPCIKKTAARALGWKSDKSSTFAERLAAFAARGNILLWLLRGNILDHEAGPHARMNLLTGMNDCVPTSLARSSCI